MRGDKGEIQQAWVETGKGEKGSTSAVLIWSAISKPLAFTESLQ